MLKQQVPEAADVEIDLLCDLLSSEFRVEAACLVVEMCDGAVEGGSEIHAERRRGEEGKS